MKIFYGIFLIMMKAIGFHILKNQQSLYAFLKNIILYYKYSMQQICNMHLITKGAT